MNTDIFLAVLIVTIMAICSEYRGYKKGHRPDIYAIKYDEFVKVAATIILNNGIIGLMVNKCN